MAVEDKVLSLAKEVESGTTQANSYTPANGKIISVVCFCGNGAHSVNSVVKAVWDYDTENEEVIWSTKGDSEIELHFQTTGDGTKKLAILLENGEDGAVVMSGMVKFVEQ